MMSTTSMVLMMLWMGAFWALVIGAGAWIAIRLARRRGGGQAASSRGGLVAVVIGAVVLVFVLVPVAVMAASGFDMRGMHHGGRNTSADPVVPGGMEETVRIDNYAFRPGNLQVPAGARVTWENDDPASHDATARDADWETERLSNGERETLTFDVAGTYDYYCSIHPNMKARLTVGD